MQLSIDRHDANSSAAQWYVRRDGVERGRHKWESIVTSYYLGRLKGSDEISLDQSQWQALASLTAGDPDNRRLRQPQLGVANGGPDAEVSSVGPSPRVLERRARAERVWASMRRSPTPPGFASRFGIVGLLALLTTLALIGRPERVSPIDCDQPLSAGVRLDFCAKAGVVAGGRDLSGLSGRNMTLTGARLDHADLRGVDLSYAEMTGADLSLADLSGSRLTGASLRQASLGFARLRDADLSYADFSGALLAGVDLRGAALDHAVWVDGRVCAPGSIGHCD